VITLNQQTKSRIMLMMTVFRIKPGLVTV